MTDPADFVVRPPKQKRTMLAWERVLDAGVALLEEGGFDALTIASVCERAGVTPPTIYARVTNKEALVLAAYERGMQALLEEESVFESSHWAGLSIVEVITGAVTAVAARFFGHAPFLRAVILRSGVESEVSRRGAEYSAGLGARFSSVILARRDELAVSDPVRAVDACFRMVFASLVMHVAYGPTFDSPRSITNEELVAELCDAAVGYLLSAPRRH